MGTLEQDVAEIAARRADKPTTEEILNIINRMKAAGWNPKAIYGALGMTKQQYYVIAPAGAE